jgi:hypothetical protein
MTTGVNAQEYPRPWDALVGPRFVEALNEGLARSAAPNTRRPPGGRRILGAPFTASVTSAYEKVLDTVLSPAEREDPGLRAALLGQAAQLLAEASGSSHEPSAYARFSAARTLPPAREAMLLTLLMECAVLVMLRDEVPMEPASRSADIVMALGASVRRSLSGS